MVEREVSFTSNRNAHHIGLGIAEMYLAIPTQTSCARAWALAAATVVRSGDEAFNVVIDVESPLKHDERDNAVICLVNDFLRKHDKYSISTVANTIFPQSMYDKHGKSCQEFYDEYWAVFDRLSTTKRWGRYFERMTRHIQLDDKQRSVKGTYNPLQQMIEKLQGREQAGIRYKAAFELAVYDPLRDGRSLYGGQCLSFLSFKHSESGLNLTAMYRNHTYITRCLGNLIGLGRLLAFVASEANIAVGSLTCISTHAEIDASSPDWGIKDARELINQANELLSGELEYSPS